jgi:hypothetical protein
LANADKVSADGKARFANGGVIRVHEKKRGTKMSLFEPSEDPRSLFKPKTDSRSLFKPQHHNTLFFDGQPTPDTPSLFTDKLTSTSSLFPQSLPAGQDSWFKEEGWSLASLASGPDENLQDKGCTCNPYGFECKFKSGTIRRQTAEMFTFGFHGTAVNIFQEKAERHAAIKCWHDATTDSYWEETVLLESLYTVDFYRFKTKKAIKIDAIGYVLPGKHADSGRRQIKDALEKWAEGEAAEALFGHIAGPIGDIADLIVEGAKSITFKVSSPWIVAEDSELLKGAITSERPFDFCRGASRRVRLDHRPEGPLDTWHGIPSGYGINDPEKLATSEEIARKTPGFDATGYWELLLAPPKAILVP